MRIIPAIDIIDGKCVRLTKGNYNTKKIYSSSPLEVAKQFEDIGIKYLHLVDLDGAKAGSIVNVKVLETLATQTKLQIDFGGGIKSDNDIKTAFNCGAAQITAGSIAVNNPEIVVNWLEKYGPDKILLGADCYDKKIAINGWQNNSNEDVIPFIREYILRGIKTVICTDISKDGMLQGPSKELYIDIITSTGTNLIASGGVTTLNDIYALKDIGCEGVIIGKAIYEGLITLKELRPLC
ncbi:MAG: 1-(5-phosphoribosyl)-5-[(5-phosphoribosylamino)methylideneamino]imidazole-4-carboxamide isomerase [Flavobacterium psychrophilum]|nr:MAG: 1-(5-phosphoribosyl)-5-[(5-phosphoribosylamino)methylideneamino]imidazole-4-carboxamide isomerase [Flavobacterium psychrophilum]